MRARCCSARDRHSCVSSAGPSTRTFASSESTTTETRALWVQRGSLATPQNIATLVKSAREHGFNTLLVQVRGRGDSYYLGGIEPRGVELLRQPSDFDPLATVLDAGHAAGLRIHAWINVNLISSAAELPSAREHLIYRRPAWLMVPRDIGQQLAAQEPDSPGYLGTLARWTRTRSAEIEGLYISPIVPDAAEYTDSIVRTLVRRYPVDGIHFDYARYPNDRFDYSRLAIRESARRCVRIPESTRRLLDAQEQDDLFAYPDSLPDQWREFRVSRMTALIDRLHATVKRERPDALVSIAVVPDVREAEHHRLQNWGAWARQACRCGLSDGVCDRPLALRRADRWRTRRRGFTSRSGRESVPTGFRRRRRSKHPDREAAWRQRRRPVFVRQPAQFTAVCLRLSIARRTRGVHSNGARAGRIPLTRHNHQNGWS